MFNCLPNLASPKKHSINKYFDNTHLIEELMLNATDSLFDWYTIAIVLLFNTKEIQL